MKKNKDKKLETESRIRRTFSVEFKKRKVADILAKRITVVQLSKLYSVTRAAIYKWLYLYGKVEKGTQIVVQMESEHIRTQALLQRVAELERLYGQKQLEIEYLNKCLELASEDLGYDVKKKYEQPLWNGSVKGDKNNPKS